ncbi:HK97 gp10 family phage protein [Clostridium tertium]|uniref:HK97 gp10 family phage protein n=1 Tax=Clostridium tertium TaxID=1559 RepID=UPI0023315303|nr:HK97 gp10 family phage protein [Clostridium tertium]MDB1935270.1 HK97 gp10 family phage protein [Clostridium tertium]MDB1939010.1 HK97 gp10 family phage protein [Clostridium tertium]
MSDNNEFVKSIENATLKIVVEASKNMEKACLLVEREAKKNCPVDQGILRASIKHDVNFNDAEIVGTVFSSLEYAPYVHQGTGIYAVNGDGRKTPWKYEVKAGKYKGYHITKGQKPNPFLDKAKLDNKDKILKILAGG